MVYQPILEKFLELQINNKEEKDIRYIYEPGFNNVWESIIPEYLVRKMSLVLSESFTSEHSARMIAMKFATDNAEEMFEQLTLLRNKIRQAGITKEISEIVAGAEAL